MVFRFKGKNVIKSRKRPGCYTEMLKYLPTRVFHPQKTKIKIWKSFQRMWFWLIKYLSKQKRWVWSKIGKRRFQICQEQTRPTLCVRKSMLTYTFRKTNTASSVNTTVIKAHLKLRNKSLWCFKFKNRFSRIQPSRFWGRKNPITVL